MYIRLGRLAAEDIFDESYTYEYGKGVELVAGNDVAIIATGLMTAQAKIAAEVLDTVGIKARVIHIPTIKPIDRDIIAKAAKETKFIVTCEEHSVIGGLGSVVADVVTETHPTKVVKIGLNDVFGESGTPAALLEKYGMTAGNVVKVVKENM